MGPGGERQRESQSSCLACAAGHHVTPEQAESAAGPHRITTLAPREKRSWMGKVTWKNELYGNGTGEGNEGAVALDPGASNLVVL